MSVARRVLVSGASSGIGAATAARFAREGWSVCLLARRGEELEEVRRGLHPGDHWTFAADYSDLPSIKALLAELGRRWDTLDALVNCAGVFAGALAVDSVLAEWRVPFDTMINGAIILTRGCAPVMKNGGRIIHVTSIHGERAETGASAYSMAKAAINQYCRALALELAPAGILVNAIAPGFIDTPMSVVDGVSELDTPWFRANYVEGHHLPLKRPGKPDEIAGVAYFLAGPDASYLTGQVITVDGGLTITF
jgi:NAD(P)-dependent dehydrogenase (short-subunit alcohol dehydrogenase family)